MDCLVEMIASAFGTKVGIIETWLVKPEVSSGPRLDDTETLTQSVARRQVRKKTQKIPYFADAGFTY